MSAVETVHFNLLEKRYETSWLGSIFTGRDEANGGKPSVKPVLTFLFSLPPFLPPLLPVALIITLSAFLHIFWRKRSQLHDDFPPVAERTAGQGTASAPTLLLVCAASSYHVRVEQGVRKRGRKYRAERAVSITVICWLFCSEGLCRNTAYYYLTW